MKARDYLKQYQEEINPFLKDYFKNKRKSFKKIDPLAEEAAKILEKFTLSGGKRVRPAMVYYGFLIGREEKLNFKEKRDVLQASMAIELIHSFLLIHDDIIDKDEKRHGVATVHKYYEETAKKFFPKKDPKHFGNSMAIIVGDLAASMANELLFESQFSPKIILEGLKQLQKIVYTTIPGEMLDVVIEAKGKATEEEVLRMQEGKTAFYTFEGPLHLGMILSGNNSTATLKKISSYSKAVGKAFQIRDDILGVFGDEKKLGKPVGSDIIEGKQTLLVIKSLENGNFEQRKNIKKLLKKKDLSHEELKRFREIVQSTQALHYSEELAQYFSKEALKFLKEINKINPQAREFLEKIAEYVSIRNY